MATAADRLANNLNFGALGKAPNVKRSLCLNSVALPNAPKFRLFASLSAAVAIYFLVNLIFPPNSSKTLIAFFEA
jgi:hypothetical protein